MKTTHAIFAAAIALLPSIPAAAQDSHQAAKLPVLVPESAGISPQEIPGVRSHTHLRVLVIPNTAALTTTPQINTPAMIRSLYSLPANGGSNAIAIVDAYNYPTALNDFNAFSAQFALPKESSRVATANNNTFQVVYAPGTKPQSGGSYIASWNMEAALDIEWAHAMAPRAKIYLVEANSDSTADLMAAVRVASALPNVKEVSMSWGGSEISNESWNLDPTFSTPGIVYLSSSGDFGGIMEYPAASPNVVACGGTTVNRSTNGTFLSETAWSDGGCGASVYERRPAFQNGVANVVGNQRGVSDFSFDADPNTGVYIYDSTPVWGESGWWVLGGTSVSAPSLAGVVNTAGTTNGFAANSQAEEARIYGNLGNSQAFRNITSGEAGSYKASVGYNLPTGVGSPHGLIGK
jgi:subtilase family serine protease